VTDFGEISALLHPIRNKAKWGSPVPKRILFVDDEPGIRDTMPQILTLHGFAVTSSASVSEALTKIASEKFDVLLSDLNIGHPGDGFTVVSAMRRTQPGCITLILTGFPAFETALEAIRSQVDEYLVKPAKIPELVELIERKLEAPKEKLPRKAGLKRMSTVIRENLVEILQRTLSAIKAQPELVAVSISNGARLHPFTPLLVELADRLDSPEEDRPSPKAMDSAVLWGRARRTQGYTIPMMIGGLRLLEQSLCTVIGEHMLELNMSHVIADFNRLSNIIMLELEVAIRSFQHSERRLAFSSSEKWSGWFCERCCWNRRQPESESERTALAVSINTEFEAHNCEEPVDRYDPRCL
jgi:ActR/RegA family two-component response regulator